MRLRRLAICALALATLPAVPPATAAGKAGCRHLIEDPRGDAAPVAPGGYDVVYGDVAVGRSEVVVVLALADLDARYPAEPGSAWQLGTTVRGSRLLVSASRAAVGGTTRSSVSVGGVGVPHTFAIVRDTLVWKFRRSAAPALRGTPTWTDASASTSAAGATADSAHGNARCAKR